MSEPGTINPETVENWIARVFIGRNMPAADARNVAEALVNSSLHGFDTHGIGMLSGYLDRLARGITNARPNITIKTQGAILKVDADRGLGQVVIARVLDAAIELAKAQGTASAFISNVGHLGALGYFTRKAAGAGMVSLVVQNGPPVMGLPGSTQRAIGNNPLSFALPVQGRAPLVFDAATSEAAYGKILQARRTGEPIPKGWALDKEGRETHDANAALDGILLPSGGFKGIGLAMLIETLAGSLTGMRPVWESFISGAFLLVIDPNAIADGARFQSHVVQWLDHYLSCSPDARYPGQRAAGIFAQRSRNGIPVDAALMQALSEIANSAGVPLPA